MRRHAGWMLACALVGCSLPTMPARTFLQQTLGPKAAFDLGCTDHLDYQNLGSAPAGAFDASGNDVVWVNGTQYKLDPAVSRQQGVTGCGRKGSYSYVDGAWIGNGASPAPATPPQ
jgi:hypothetical protein